MAFISIQTIEYMTLTGWRFFFMTGTTRPHNPTLSLNRVGPHVLIGASHFPLSFRELTVGSCPIGYVHSFLAVR